MHWRNPVEIITEAMSIGHKSPQWKEPLYKHAGGPKQTFAGADVNTIVCDCVEAGKVLAAVEHLPKVARSWAWFCYGPDESAADQATVIDHVWRKVYRERQNFKQTHRLTVLTFLAVQEAQQVARTDTRKFAEADLAVHLGVSRQNWQQTYKPVFDRAVDNFLDLNKAALHPVIALMYRYRKAEREEEN